MVPLTCTDLNCWCNIDGKGHPQFDESEHDRTGGPVFTESDSIGVPLQEQVEQVEDALGKALSVIEAFVEQEKDLRTLVYQAQLDAQDWQNKYNAAAHFEPAYAFCGEIRKILGNDYPQAFIDDAVQMLMNDRDAARSDLGHVEGLLYDEKQKTLDYENLRTRVYKLTDENAGLEVRNERQAKRGEHARQVIAGVWDHTLKF